MIIADTSIWVEFFKRIEPIFSSLVTLLENRNIIGLSCIFGELLQGARNKRERQTIQSYWENLPRTDESSIFIEAGIYSSEQKLLSKGIGLIAAVILVAARNANSQVWTLDKKLLNVLAREDQFHLANGVSGA